MSVTKEFAGFFTTAVNIEGDVKLMLEGDTFMMFRYSDTEPVMRVYVEAQIQEVLETFLTTVTERVSADPLSS